MLHPPGHHWVVQTQNYEGLSIGDSLVAELC